MPNNLSLTTTTEINLDVNTPGISIVHAKQYDTARKVKAHLFYNGVRWYVPEDNVLAVVSYKKADHIGGFYDTTEDGQSAISIDGGDGSSVYISLDRQTLTTVGNVSVEITFYNAINTSRLSTFSFIVQVEAASLTELDLASNPYFNVLAKDIAAVLRAEENMAGLTASGSKIAPGATPSVTVSGGSDGAPYNFAFGIPTFAGINSTPTVTTLPAGSSASASVSGGTSGTSKYSLSFGIPKGDKGDKPVPTSIAYAYAISTSGTTVPSSGWTSTPAPVKGKYLWCRSIVTWDGGGTSTAYAVGYVGLDGGGSTASDILTSSQQTVQEVLDAHQTSINKKPDFLSFTNKVVAPSAFVTDPEHLSSQYTLRAPISASGVTANMFADVVFNLADATDGNYAPITKTATDTIYIYASTAPSSNLTIPSIMAFG